MLWEVFARELGKKPGRQKSLSREAHEADAHDIVSGFSKLDSDSLKKNRFVHWNLDNVPKFAPE